MKHALLNGLHDGFFLPALAVLALFYLIYFAKLLAQKKRGIQTRQLGKGKDRTTRLVETALSIVTFAIVPAQLLSMFLGWSSLPGVLRIAGGVAGLLGDLIFLAAVVTMRDSWRAGIPSEEKTALVSDGIYSYSRNPAFVGFDLMYVGILLLYFNALLLVLTALAVLMLHLQILQEEKFLCAAFGEEYDKYKECTSRYLGRKDRSIGL